ncbi:hypothetical protein ABPG72_022099 [Tetrahymena utriculariae]
MDPVLGDIIATRIYKACFKQVYAKNMKAYSEKDEAKFDQCLTSYVESYKSVTNHFITYLGQLPKKGLSLDGS